MDRKKLLNRDEIENKWYIFDENFKSNKLRYASQSLLASIVLGTVLIGIDAFIDFVIISALGATTFILFAMPQKISSTPRRVIGGYVIGVVVGKAFLYLLNFMDPSIHQNVLIDIFGAISVGVTFFLMTVLNMEHPPAVGVSLVIILHGYEWRTLILIVIAVMLLVIIQNVLRKWLIDLL